MSYKIRLLLILAILFTTGCGDRREKFEPKLKLLILRNMSLRYILEIDNNILILKKGYGEIKFLSVEQDSKKINEIPNGKNISEDILNKNLGQLKQYLDLSDFSIKEQKRINLSLEMQKLVNEITQACDSIKEYEQKNRTYPTATNNMVDISDIRNGLYLKYGLIDGPSFSAVIASRNNRFLFYFNGKTALPYSEKLFELEQMLIEFFHSPTINIKLDTYSFL